MVYEKRRQIGMCWLEWLNCRANGFNASLSLLSTTRECSQKQSPSFYLYRPCTHISVAYGLCKRKTFALVHVERSELLTDSMGSEILSSLWMNASSARAFDFFLESLKSIYVYLSSNQQLIPQFDIWTTNNSQCHDLLWENSLTLRWPFTCRPHKTNSNSVYTNATSQFLNS